MKSIPPKTHTPRPDPVARDVVRRAVRGTGRTPTVAELVERIKRREEKPK